MSTPEILYSLSFKISKVSLYRQVNNIPQPEIKNYNCLSQIFMSDYINEWVIQSHSDPKKIGQKVQISFDASRGMKQTENF